MKQKRNNNNNAEVEPLKLLNFFLCDNTDIQALIDKVDNSREVTEHLECVKLFAKYLAASAKPEDTEYVLKFLGFIYLFNTPKSPIKKSIGRTFSTFEDSNLLSKKLSESIDLIVDFISLEKDPNCMVKMKDEFISGMHTSWDLAPAVHAIYGKIDFLFSYVFAFLLEMGNYLWERKLPLPVFILNKNPYIHNASKFILQIIQKCNVTSIKEEDRLNLITCCYEIATHAHITYNTKNNCAYVIVHMFKALPDDIVSECSFKEHPYFELLKFGKEHSYVLEKLGIKAIQDPIIFETFKVCIYLAIMNVAPWVALFETSINNETVFSSIFADITQLVQRTKGNPNQIIWVTNAIAVSSPYLQNLPPEKVNVLFNEVLNYIILYLDDTVETIRNHTRTVLRNLIKLAVKYQDQGDSKLIQALLQWLESLRDGVYYRALMEFASEISCTFLLLNIPGLPKQLLGELVHPSKAHNICMCYENLMQLHLKEVTNKDIWLKYWVNEIVSGLRKSKPDLMQYFQRLFLSAFKMRPGALKVLTQERFLNNDAEIGAFLTCLHYVRKTGLKVSADDLYGYKLVKAETWHNLLECDTLEVLMTHQNNDIRIQVLAVIMDTQKSTELFTEWELKLLPKYFRYNINTPNASMRQQLIAYAKKTLQRIDNSLILALKNCDDPKSQAYSEKVHLRSIHAKFLHAMHNDVLLVGIHPDCNHSRKSGCLELLYYVVDLFPMELYFHFWNSQTITNLKYILQFDTYERNKELAAQILSCVPLELLYFDKKELLTKYINQCFTLASSIKPAQTISAAYMLKLALKSPFIGEIITEKLHKSVGLKDIKNTTVDDCFEDTVCLLLLQLIVELTHCATAGEYNIQKAAAHRPIHGFLFCIRLLLKDVKLEEKVDKPQWKLIIKDLLDWCYRLGKIIDPIICNQSPEGYLPDDIDEDFFETDETAKAQMVTVYGWRAAKEISLLLGELALKAPFSDDRNIKGLIDSDQLKLIGNYFFNLMLNTKHRGAFEQASVGFSYLCKKLWILPADISNLPAQWLDIILGSLLGNAENLGDICATRRSAGVPFMVQAILTTEPNNEDYKHFRACMNILLGVAGDFSKPEDQRVHCMNILRALYRHSQLGELVAPYCARGVMISVEGFGSSSWGVRNSATLLFSALTVRIFGVQRVRDAEIVSIKNKMLAQVFFTRYPELYGFLLKKVEEGVKNVHDPSLFPVLLVLSRLYNCEGSSEAQLQSFLPFLAECLCNPVHKIRDLAAKIVVNVISKTEARNLIQETLICLRDVRLKNNRCHGLLLQLQYLLQSQEDDLPQLNMNEILNKTGWILVCRGSLISHVTATVYVEILLYLIGRFNLYLGDCDNCDFFIKLRLATLGQATATKKLKMYLFNLKLYVLLNLLECSATHNRSITVNMVYPYIFEDIKAEIELQHMCRDYINFIVFSEPEFQDHYLYDEDDFDYSELINKFLKPLGPMMKQALLEILHEMLKHLLTTQQVQETTHLEMLLIHDFPENLHHYDTHGAKQWVLEYCLFACQKYEEHPARLCIAWLDKFLSKLTDLDLQMLYLDRLVDTIMIFCSPSAELSRRLAMARLLVNNKRLFYRRDWNMTWSNICMLWQAVFILLEDDDEDVRNTICCICEQDITLTVQDYTFVPRMRRITPELAREVLLFHMVNVLPSHCSVNMLLSLILRTRVVNNGNLSEVFEEGMSNTYAELYPMAAIATDVLNKILWQLDDGLNFKDKSIFLEEQILLIATTLYDKFYRNVVPLLSPTMTTIARNVLTHIILFVEKGPISTAHFKPRFRKVLNQALSVKDIKDLDASENIRLKMLFNKIFKPALL